MMKSLAISLLTISLLPLAACSKLPGFGKSTASGAGVGDAGGKQAAHEGGALGLAMSPDGKLVASGGKDKLVKLWDVGDRKVVATLTGHEGIVTALAFSPDGKQLVSGDESNAVKIWDVASRKEARALAIGGAVTRIAFAPDGSKFFVGASNSTITTVAGEAEPAVMQHENPISNKIADLVVASDGKLLGIDSLGVTIVYDTAGAPGTKLVHSSRGNAVSFAPQGGFYSAGMEGSAKLWDAAGTANPAFKCAELLFTALRVTPAGNALVAGTEDGTVHVLDPATCAQKKTFEAHIRTVSDLAVTPDGKRVVTVGTDGGLGIWSID